MTYEGRDAILRYKSSDSYKINEKLYSGQEINEQEAKLVADINSALDKLPIYQGKVYRNLSFDLKGQDAFDNFIRMHKKGGFVSYPAFTSTSKTPDGYVVDGELLVHIEIYSANGRDIENIGDKDEKEVLFKTDPLFIVKDIQFDGKVANIILEEDGYDRIRERHVLQHSSERSAAVRNLQESHTDDFNVQGVSRENPGRNNARQMGPQRALPGGQRDIVRTGGSELHSGGAVRQEQDRLNIEIDTDIDTELVQAVKEEDAKVELDILTDLLEVYENAENINEKSDYVSWVSGSGWLQQGNRYQNNLRNVARGQNNQNVGILQGQSQRNGSRAFQSVIENLLGKQLEIVSNSDNG